MPVGQLAEQAGAGHQYEMWLPVIPDLAVVPCTLLIAALLLWFALAAQRWQLPPTPMEGLTAGGLCCVTCGKGGYDQLQPRLLSTATSRSTQGAVPEGQDATPPELLVTVRVQAAGVNYADVCIRWGLYASWNKFGGGTGTSPSSSASPIRDVPGFEFAGTVEAVGAAVSNCSIGDQVFGVTLFGAYSSRLVVPSHLVFRRPATLSAQQAAALPAVAMTAYFAIMRQASPIAAGDPVLVHSAAGGVGSMLVQMCKIKGWRVCAVVGAPHKVAACTALGADCVIDKSGGAKLWGQAEAFAPHGFAAIFDANGVATLSQSWEHLAPCGKLIVYGFHTMLPRHGGVLGPLQWLRMARDWLRTPRFNPLDMTATNRSVLAFNLSFLFDRRDIFQPAMVEIMRWVSEGKLCLPKVSSYPLGDVRMAHAAIESGSTVGKLVLLPP